jgi:hypothetical protein
MIMKGLLYLLAGNKTLTRYRQDGAGETRQSPLAQPDGNDPLLQKGSAQAGALFG